MTAEKSRPLLRLSACVLVASIGAACTGPPTPAGELCGDFNRLKESALRTFLGVEEGGIDTWRFYIDTMSASAERSGDEELIEAVRQLGETGERVAAGDEPAATELDEPRFYSAFLELQALCER